MRCHVLVGSCQNHHLILLFYFFVFQVLFTIFHQSATSSSMSCWDPPVQRCLTSFRFTVANVPSRHDAADLIISSLPRRPCCLPDSPRRLRSAVHPQPVRHLGLPRRAETQLVPPVGHPHCSAPAVEPHVSDEGHQPEVIFCQHDLKVARDRKAGAGMLMMLFLSLFRFLSQCTEYFDLRCQLLDDLTSESTELLLLFIYLFLAVRRLKSLIAINRIVSKYSLKKKS